MFENSYIYFVTFVFLSPFSLLCKCSDTSRLPTELWCVNSDCSEPISEGVVQIQYFAGVKEGISLKPGHKVKIYSKSATPGIKRWEVELPKRSYLELLIDFITVDILNNGKRGFVPEGIITERKVLVKKSDLKRVAYQDKLAVKIDSVPVVDVLKHDIEDVEAILKRPSLVSSFALPGSLADDSLKDVKDKINPQNVRVVVGTTFYDDPSDSSTPYASYTPEDPISGDSKPPVQSVGTAEKVPDEVGKSEVGKVDSVVKKEVVVDDETSKSKIDASEQTTESSSVFSSTPVDMKSKNVDKQESVTPTPKITEDEESDFYGDDEDEDDEEGGDEEEEEEEEEEVEEGVVEENKGFVSSESSDEIRKGKDEAKEQINQVTPPVNEVSENGTKDAVMEKDIKDVEKTIEKDKVSEKKTLEIFDQAVTVTEQNISISVESTEKLDEVIQKDSNKAEIIEKIESVEKNLNDTVNSQVTEVPIKETNITTDSSNILSNITDSEKYLGPFFSTDSNVDKPPVSTPPDENKDDEKKKFENVSQMASDETVSPDPLTVDSSVTLHTFIKKHDSLEELSSKINAKQSELDDVKLDQKDKDSSTFNELSESETKVNEQINVSTENQGSVDGLVGSTPAILETEKSVVNKDAEGVLQELTAEINNDSIDLTKTVESVETFETTTQYPIENPLLPPKMDDYHEHYTEIPSTRNDELETQQMPEGESNSVNDEIKSSGLEVDEGDDSKSGGWFDFGFITNLFSSTSEEQVESQPDVESDIPAEEPQENFEQGRTTITPYPSQIPPFKETDEHCTIEDGVTLCNVPSYSKESDDTNSWDVVKDVYEEELLNASQTVAISTDSIIYLIITAITVILFSLGYYYIENHKYDGALVAKINVLERDLLIVKKEAALVQEKLTTAESQVLMNKDSLSEFDEQLSALTQELEETRAAKLELEEQYMILEKEFDAATESGLEMHRLLTESLSTQDGSQVLLKTVESLREKLDNQDGEIKELKQLLSEKSEEIEKLHEEIKNDNETRKALEDKLLSLRREKDEELLQINDKNRTLSTQLGDVMEEKSLMELKLSNELSKLRLLVEDTQSTLADREGEIDTLREAIAKLNKHDKEENLEALYDTAKVTSKLLNAEKERDNYKEKFLEEEGARKLLEDHVQLTRQEVNSLKENYEAAEKEKIEALTKLQVLSNYFKEKESQLQKELGTQESMWLQKQSDDHTIYEQMKSLREENEKYKVEPQTPALGVTKKKKKKVQGKKTVNVQQTQGLQNESLKKEICESESAFKIQIANAEQKAHDNWLASRQLERRLKETQNEATQLRNRLTLVEKNATNSSSDDLKQNMNELSSDELKQLSYGIVESNGDPSSPPPTISMFPPATSPPFMMFGGPPPPPPTSEFLPPPPPPPLGFPEGRPAPVGRISSPPLDHSFSPPPPLPYFYDSAVYGGQHSPSPPPHRPMPKPMRDMGMDPKEFISPIPLPVPNLPSNMLPIIPPPPPPPPPLNYQFLERNLLDGWRTSSPIRCFSPDPPPPVNYDNSFYENVRSPLSFSDDSIVDRSSPPRHSEQQERTGRRSKR